MRRIDESFSDFLAISTNHFGFCLMDPTMDTGNLMILPDDGMEAINPQFQQVHLLQATKNEVLTVF